MRGQAPVEFLLDPEAAPGEILAAIGATSDLSGARRTTVERTFYDSFDGRLRARGYSLECGPTRRGEAASVTLIGHHTTLGISRLLPSSRRDRVLAEDIEPGVVQDRVRRALRGRALLPVARVRSQQVTAAVRDERQKTVVRVLTDEPLVLRGGRARVLLQTRLVITPVLGYQRAFTEAVRALADLPGVERATTSLAAEAAHVGTAPAPTDRPVLAAGMRADDGVRRLCAQLAETVEANLPGTLAELDTEFLHDLRIAVRRTRTLLRELKAVIDPEVRTQARADLRWLQAVTGPVRDLDVQLLAWPELDGWIAAGTAADLEPLRQLLVDTRIKARRTMVRQLRGPRFSAFWTDWRKRTEGGLGSGPRAAAPIEEVGSRRIRAVYRDMVRAGRAIDDNSPPEPLHDLRKRGKELRYLLELLGPLWPEDQVRAAVVAAKGLQDVLGEFQDSHVQATQLQGLVSRLVTMPGGPDALVPLARYLDHLATRQQLARAAFADRFESFASPATRQLIRGTFVGHAAAS